MAMKFSASNLEHINGIPQDCDDGSFWDHSPHFSVIPSGMVEKSIKCVGALLGLVVIVSNDVGIGTKLGQKWEKPSPFGWHDQAEVLMKHLSHQDVLNC